MDLLVPTLAEPLAKTKIEKLLADDNFNGEIKLDGERMLVHVDNTGTLMGGTTAVIPVNRKGERTTLPSSAMHQAFADLTTGQWAFDGEVVDHEFYIFDMPIAGNAITPDSPFGDRRAVLEQFMSRWNPGAGIHLIHSYTGEQAKRDLMQRVMAHGGEGIMLKDRRARYFAGKRTDRIAKIKFWKSVDVIIKQIRLEGKDNASMVLICPDYDNDCGHRDDRGRPCKGEVTVGSISTIGKGPVQPGNVFEVKFLYAVDRCKPRLYQPTILRKRDDKDMAECTIDQLDTTYTNKKVLEVVQ